MTILLTGDYSGDEFAAAVAEMGQTCELVKLPAVSSAAEWLVAAEAPADLAVVAQARPGQFSGEMIDALRRAAPLTPIVALLGAWCEGEMRSGAPWPGVTRVYWHQWAGRFPREMQKIARGEANAWGLPITATAEERLLWAARPCRIAPPGVVAVMSGNNEIADWLAAACRQRGLSAIVLGRPPTSQLAGLDTALWDAGLPTAAACNALQGARPHFAGAPVIALADFPRFDDVKRLSSAGATAVISKPLTLHDLHWRLDDVRRVGYD